jgi:hypothetical protein
MGTDSQFNDTLWLHERALLSINLTDIADTRCTDKGGVSLDNHFTQFCFFPAAEEWYLRLCSRNLETNCLLLEELDWQALSEHVTYPVKVHV